MRAPACLAQTREISIDDIDAYQRQQARARARRKERYRQPKEAAAAVALLKMLVWVAGKIVLLVKAVVAAVARAVTMAIALLPPTAPRRWPQAPIGYVAEYASAWVHARTVLVPCATR